MIRLLSVVGVVAALQQMPSSLVIRSGDLSTPLPVLVTQRGPMVRLEEGIQALGAALVRTANDKYRLILGGAEIELSLGVAVARTRNGSEPLAAPPSIFDGKLLVPLALLTDVVPRVARGYSYRSASGELWRDMPAPERVAPSVAA
ncbi:MAG: hypothetical protein H7066_05375, partial [Cytophagaceae bacterium]|nr:hypothetical protein [Gemmatimonadaceae bacterium]